ncbi:MAG: nitroreductase family protein [Candidatus Marinimicrobia bacterium]|jgi:nitroreductase|nr:nitroreductase family protein [Candidatus Neomarinimicrobiota bacterium]MBT3632910.1 nitroreductase family protein [Candidatus Neomarinimicrobiota bacterium]MBT3682020.1 nitroreductase family protein [Candidatus Neomarinimicrobiota bacterium]MBT3758951.1 nitroreductase family protein [Candidatus Neomarinimicrobiota bacterium]MBT3895150.1 nitroreductase family protein [Candidatus Neomarinimicrobiota bacterium]
MSPYPFIPFELRIKYSEEEAINKSLSFYTFMNYRRTIREFSDVRVSDEVIKNCLLTAGTAPSGANQQPWKFVVVSNPALKQEIRMGAEAEEKEFYEHRAPEEWLKALEPLGTDDHKPFLETAPCLIVIFEEKYGLDDLDNKIKRYYSTESTGLATGMLITAIHNAGMVSLTHTPSPMKFLNTILDIPVNYKPYLILVTGYPADGVTVPDITRKSLEDIAVFR